MMNGSSSGERATFRPTRTRGEGGQEAAPARWPTVVVWVFGVSWVAATGLALAGAEPPVSWRWVELLLAALACLAALSSLIQRLALQNGLAIGSIMLLFSVVILGSASHSGIPLGAIDFTDQLGPILFGHVPLALPFYWVAILASSRETARLILLPRRRDRWYGLLIIAGAVGLTIVTDLNLEPYAVHAKHYWSWPSPPSPVSWYSAPWTSPLGWAISTVVILGFCVPWFISKRASRMAPPFQPALVWGLLNLGFLAGNAAQGLWLAVVFGGTLTGAALWLAWRGKRLPPQGHHSPGEAR
jgi:uncharacterized membrane protein